MGEALGRDYADQRYVSSLGYELGGAGMQTEGSKPALGTLGQKYDQYIDFAQLPQDAHEFFRIAMGMEEQDIFKIPRNNDTDSRRLSGATLPCTPGFRCVPYRTWVMEKAEDADEACFPPFSSLHFVAL